VPNVWSEKIRISKRIATIFEKVQAEARCDSLVNTMKKMDATSWPPCSTVLNWFDGDAAPNVVDVVQQTEGNHFYLLVNGHGFSIS